MTKWLLYNVVVCWAVYWLSNLILWFPWSINPWLGMSLMLTVSPVIWAYSSYLCLRSYPKTNSYKAAAINAIIFLILAIVMDYIFFGLIRNAMEQLYHPTTYYGYGFVICLPFIIALLFKGQLKYKKQLLNNISIIKAGITGLLAFGILCLIILFGTNIT